MDNFSELLEQVDTYGVPLEERDTSSLQRQIDMYQKEIETLRKTMAANDRESSAWKQAEYRLTNREELVKKLRAQIAKAGT